MIKNYLYNIDAIIIIIYLIIIFAIGIYYRSMSKSIENYTYVQRSIRTNRFVLAATVFSAAIGGGTTFGLTERAFSGNIAYSYALFIVISVDIIVGIYIVPKISQYYGSISIGDIMNVHYGKPGRIISGIAVVISSLGYLAVQISVSGYLLSGIFGLNYMFSLILSYTLLTIYTTIGGLQSILISNVIQFCVMIIGVPLFTFFAIKEINFTEFLSHIPSIKYSFSEGTILNDTILLALSFSVVICYPSFVQSALLNRDSKLVTKAIITKSIIFAFFLFCITLNGLIIYYLMPNVESNMALQEAINAFVPIGFSAIVIIGFLSAAMSTADTDLNLAALSVSRDILMPIFNIKNSNHLLIIAKITSMLIGSISIFISLKFTSIIDIVLVVAALWAPLMLVPFIAALFNKKVSNMALVICSICAIMSCLIWDKWTDSKLQGTFIGTVINLICFITSYYYGRRIRRTGR